MNDRIIVVEAKRTAPGPSLFLALGKGGAILWQPFTRCATFDTYAEAVVVAKRVDGVALAIPLTTPRSVAAQAHAARQEALRRALVTVCRGRCPECGSQLNALTTLREGVWVDSLLPNGAIRKLRLPATKALTCPTCEYAEVIQ